MTYNTYIFDFDYTLADATVGIVESANYALGQIGLKPQQCDDIRKTVGMTLRDAFVSLTGINDEPMVSSFVAHFKEKADTVMTAHTILFDDSIRVLTFLKENNCNTAIVTSKFRYRIEDVLHMHKIPHLIDYIVGFEDVETHKPSPEGLLKAINYFNCIKESVLYIGDSLIDANTAKNANIDFAGVLTGTTMREEMTALPHVVIINRIGELILL